MKKTMTKSISALLITAFLLPVFCSCSLFKKSAVLEAASEFASALTVGDTSDILKKTDGLEKEFKKEFNELFKTDNYSYEELQFNSAMMQSMEIDIDPKSVKVDKDTATCDMAITIADYGSLTGGDFKDGDELAAAVGKCKTRDIDVTAEFKLIDKEWYVTNFDDKEFQDIYSFLKNIPAVGRSELLTNAGEVARSTIEDNYSFALNVAASLTDDIDLPSYLENVFDNGEPSEEEKIFRAEIVNAMSYEVNGSSLQMDTRKGSVDLIFYIPDYETLANTVFKNADEIQKAVRACPLKEYRFTCDFIRVSEGPSASGWFVTNLQSDDFTALLGYKHFSISVKKIDGVYTATIDITDKFVAYVASEYNIKMPDNLEGTIAINSTLTLKNGNYEVTIDRDAFVGDIKAFVEKNIDKIIMNMLGTTSAVGLDALAKIAGYKNYEDMKQQVLKDVMTNIETISTSGLESSGTFQLVDDKITLKSATDTMPGTIDNYGVITVTAPVNDPDAKKLLGSDTITLPFKKA